MKDRPAVSVPEPMPMEEPSLPEPSHAKPTPQRTMVTEAQKRRAYMRYIVRHYRTDPELANRIVQACYSAAGTFRLKPPLLLGVIAVESSFDPDAFNGVDVGLMQVNPAFHPEKVAKIGGPEKLYDVDKNVYVGAWVLRQFLNSTRSERAALLRYSGSQRFGRDYPVRVAAQKEALERAAGTWSSAATDEPAEEENAPLVAGEDAEGTSADWSEGTVLAQTGARDDAAQGRAAR